MRPPDCFSLGDATSSSLGANGDATQQDPFRLQHALSSYASPLRLLGQHSVSIRTFVKQPCSSEDNSPAKLSLLSASGALFRRGCRAIRGSWRRK
eukprot:scaffold48_cov311-Pinguiococcus_pyrenoidosus.AAC.18